MKRALAAIAALILGCGRTGLYDTLAGATAASSGSTGPGGAGGAGGAGGTGGASGTGGAGGAGGAVPACLTCGEPEVTGAITNPEEKELSGVVASALHPGALYVHNDSGDVPRFFAIDAAGATLATFAVSGAQAIDWEDIARGPCPAGSCVYLGDIGDNDEKRTSYVVYRVPEPSTLADATAAAEALPFTYPDGAHNAETLLVHPITGVITVVTKTFSLSGIYELPAPSAPGQSVVAKKLGTISLPIEPTLITGGDVHPGARGVLIRTYGEVYFFPMAKGASVGEALLGAACPAPAPFEPQGEAIGWLPDASGYITLSEKVGSDIHRVKCTPP